MTAGDLVSVLSGLLLGIRHAAEPDHLAAVGVFLPERASLRKAASMGALWGGGHAATMVLLGSLLIALRVDTSPLFDSSLEFGVGAMLVILGVRSLWVHRHRPHGADQADQATASETDGESTPTKAKSRLSLFAVGAAHGVAGAGSVVLLAASAIENQTAALAFLMLFALGSMVGMAIAAGIANFSLRTAADQVRKRRRFSIRSLLGAVSVGVGVFWMIRAAEAFVA